MQLSVMTYNIQGHAAARRADHLPKIAEVISSISPDVIGLQEVHCRTRASRIDQAESLATLTGYQLAFGNSCSMDGGEYGNAVLTRGQVIASHVHPLPGSGEARSLLQVDLEVDGARFCFFVTHLAAWGRLLRLARLKQTAELGDIIARARPPRVLVGDFNVPPAAEEIRMLLSHGHLRVAGEGREPTFPMTRQRLDYIFCDSAWEVSSSEVVHRGPSDHWPLVAALQLREKSNQAGAVSAGLW